MTTPDRYGPNADTIQFVLANQVSALTAERAQYIMLMSQLATGQTQAQHRALAAARSIPGREAQAVRASEDMRKAIWSIVWDGTQADAERVSWAAAMCGIGLATADLVGHGDYTADDYAALVGPWLTGGFEDLPLRKES